MEFRQHARRRIVNASMVVAGEAALQYLKIREDDINQKGVALKRGVLVAVAAIDLLKQIGYNRLREGLDNPKQQTYLDLGKDAVEIGDGIAVTMRGITKGSKLQTGIGVQRVVAGNLNAYMNLRRLGGIRLGEELEEMLRDRVHKHGGIRL
ncbi:MAG: hypothetical protein KGH72_00175 [Candidatus Micrarchaeota archaeon]|nr:hypothetical protein [Candidatus Micrarchaeota archaeon]